ncbi:MAG TPA: TonB-dependent receptor [Longimicrobium sp.]|nr:TonB-dependent receptor [Longimicrobium sp.]
MTRPARRLARPFEAFHLPSFFFVLRTALHPARRCGVLLATAAALVAGTAGAQVRPAGDTIPLTALDTITVTGRIDNLIGSATTASEGYVGAADIATRPLLREGEILETVPGLIVTQHSGDGKANQYFVRGFNLDHGTDFHTRVEGMPVNMPSHGHGQGYTDLNFLIPEFVEYLDYRLGVSHAEVGDFGSAGAAHIHLVRELDRPFVVAEGGQNGFARAAGGASTRAGGGTLLLGGEARAYDGPWELPQEMRKLAGIGRWTRERGTSRLSVLALAYRNRWNASDQIPLRAVESGRIGRYAQIDSTDGGNAQRYSLSVEWSQATPRLAREAQLFGIWSDLDLYSNFGYFLDDPLRGDQFHQRDRRLVTGANLRQTQRLELLGRPHALTVGAQLRGDFIGGLGLYRTKARARQGTIRQDEVTTASGGVFAEARTRWSPWLSSVLGVRADGFSFDVESDRAENSGAERAGIVSPKASLVFTPSPIVEMYLSGGFGFHSNDARGTVITVDPASGEAAEPVDPLVRSRGAEIGLRAAPLPGLRSTLTLWALELESELLFVGDAGATEPTATSRRQGVTWANFWRPLPSLSVDADVSFARARLSGVPYGEDRIPAALENVFAGGVAWMPSTGATAALRLRHFGAYPLIEDNSVRAQAATLLNAEAGYRLGRGVRIEAALLNLLDSDARDIQYYYASRLQGEPAEGVEDIHFHPVEPRQLRVTLRWEF